ncbi:hypothetical protein [Leucothrix arctica]|uniref:Uncharacterized protein n=1 Tax=Leucothrix arctica TaxID=1481894 RepID=A0A317CEH1_9GAMM|nr:hypothetical protein [Leucothrix arctica]PWQ96759.1 hypothetical protein DKT75_08285 [Leucothrix arctica]
MEITDTKIITTIIAGAAAILGAVIGGYFKAISAKQKILELNQNYNQKLQDNYLEKAREYTESVYAPLSIALATLSYSFRKYQTNIETDNEQELITELSASIDDFNSVVMGLMSKGAGAFLTTELDERLQSFGAFLDASKSADNPILKMVLSYKLPLLGSGFQETKNIISGKFAQTFWSPRLSIPMRGFGISYEAKETLAAPFESRNFEARFVRDVHIINVLIKEVTLGAKAKHSINNE